MDIQKETVGILDLLICPGFFVKENIITDVNAAAAGLLLTPGTDIRSLLLTGTEEYAEFQGGCLNLKLNLNPTEIGACVFRKDHKDLFVLEQAAEDTVLQALALTAQEIRGTMAGAIIATDQLSRLQFSQDPKVKELLARANRSLHQLLRLTGNMSDAGTPSSSQQQICNIGRVVTEILEKAQSLVQHAGITLEFDPMPEQVFTLLDASQLERALLNMISNAMRFTPKGGSIHVHLRQKGNYLRLSVRDNGCGIGEEILGTLFRRYLRQNTIEDSRHGLGLGMVLIRCAAAAHGGTVLIDQPEGGGTRVTMTLAIREHSESMLRSSLMQPDYAGERDHVLLELSDCLPYHLY